LKVGRLILKILGRIGEILQSLYQNLVKNIAPIKLKLQDKYKIYDFKFKRSFINKSWVKPNFGNCRY